MTIDYVDAGHATDQATASGVLGEAPPVVQGVTFDRLCRARSEPQNWLTYYGDYDGYRYSELDQIDTTTVKDLAPAWMFQHGSVGLHAGASTYAFEAAPLVVDGVMFVSGWDGWVWALDAATGQEMWRYRHAIPYDVTLCCGNVNRGVAVAEGKVFVATLNAHVVALDATNGRKVWDMTSGDVRTGESLTVAPLVVKDVVIVGSSGGEFGVRGHLDAFDLATGEHRWRTYTIPKPGEPGSDTWPDGEQWARGGGNGWVTGTYDPDLDLVYWGTGNPAPDFDGEVREGDNLYTNSCVALNPDDGAIVWHYQYTPHDLWDYDSNMEHILFEEDGRKLLAHFNKNGYFYVLDRTDGELVRVTPFSKRITWGEVHDDGSVTPKIYPQDEGVEVHFYPGPGGGKEWTHAAYSPRTGLFYVPVQDVGASITRRRQEFKESIPFWGASVTVDSDTDDMCGYILAVDSHGTEKWRWRNDLPMCASVLATAGDVVFAGTPSGEYLAFDATDGTELWRFQCGSGHHSSPTTYSVDGRQFVAVPSGWGAWAEGFLPGMLGAPHGNTMIAFALPQR